MRLVNTTSFRKASIGQESIGKPSVSQCVADVAWIPTIFSAHLTLIQ